MTTDIASSGAGPCAAKHAAAGRRLAALAAARRVAPALLLLLWAAAAGVGLGSSPLMDSDEGRNAGAAVLGESGDLVAWARGCAPGR